MESKLNWFHVEGKGNSFEKRAGSKIVFRVSCQGPIPSPSLGCSPLPVLFAHSVTFSGTVGYQELFSLAASFSAFHDSSVMKDVNALELLLWNSSCKVSKWTQSDRCFSLQQKPRQLTQTQN